MTVLTDFIALMPILWATSPGAGPMKRIAVPVIFGVITSAVHTLVLIPVYYTLYKRWEQWKESRLNRIESVDDQVRSTGSSGGAV
jgi:Cu(I)/Ag(I) efflux system membrane protein CusA/SilA